MTHWCAKVHPADPHATWVAQQACIAAALATLDLVDPTTQGVCPDGHPCVLGLRTLTRRCTGGEYEGMPLTRPGLTPEEINEAAAKGADPDVVAWAAATIADQEA